MIAAWRVRSAGAAFVEPISALPRAPAASLSGLVAGLDSAEGHDELLRWVIKVRRTRPRFPVGAILRRDTIRLVEGFLENGIHLKPIHVMSGQSLGEPPQGFLLRLAHAALASEIRRDWESRFHSKLEGRLDDLLFRLAEHGSRGGSVENALAGTGWSPRTLSRHLERAGWPPPGALLRLGRGVAYRIRVESGVSPTEAVHLGGWASQDSANRTLRRFKGVLTSRPDKLRPDGGISLPGPPVERTSA